ncbi:PSP1 domain-containing protein [Zavarzinella formosa]|uniref:PSP1 domain-containing protein n=1 Tax=Zavarzinella formosa TaxID=360055 RepID=UPI000310174C|nr:regulatory iron-sulfur-containing complex subunit RicT [Zavarzinella formosa]
MSISTTVAASSSHIVRHGTMRLLGEYVAVGGVAYARNSRVILKTERGLEVGEVLCPATPQAVAQLSEPTRGDIVRQMTIEDLAREQQIKLQSRTWFETAVKLVGEHRLAMQVVDIEPLFGHERLVFYFLSEKRIDFRELVRSMAREFQTRIELRQIGVRDEAKLLADYGDCGKPVCCNTHMSVMPPVTMRMAKIQKSTLDPNKISGRCGRLKCCLRFEQDVYDEFLEQLPPVGARVVTSNGQGRVVVQEILARRLIVQFEDGRRLPVPLADILTRL